MVKEKNIMRKKSLFKGSMLLALNLIASAALVTGVVFTLLTYSQNDGVAYYTSMGSQLILGVYFLFNSLVNFLAVKSEVKRIKNENLDKEIVKRAAELVTDKEKTLSSEETK
jgi:uncharacterized membrane protein YcjF (UPF0283 family)